MWYFWSAGFCCGDIYIYIYLYLYIGFCRMAVAPCRLGIGHCLLHQCCAIASIWFWLKSRLCSGRIQLHPPSVEFFIHKQLKAAKSEVALLHSMNEARAAICTPVHVRLVPIRIMSSTDEQASHRTHVHTQRADAKGHCGNSEQ